MFEQLSNRLQSVVKKLRGQGRLTEENIQESLREVRLALLEADVNFKVVKNFVQRVQERAVGQEVLESITPGQKLVKIVHEELVALMGQNQGRLTLLPNPPTVIMLVGLQGCGKTTTCGKLGLMLRKNGHNPLLVAADVRRPAAVEQLKTLCRQLNLTCYSAETDAVGVCKQARGFAQENEQDVIIVDTAGRLHIDEDLLQELKDIKRFIAPHEILLAADAMTGQEAVNVARNFHNAVGIDGVILTKMDGDARGGAALSIKETIQKPIKFIGVGEKLDALEPFHPERMASRILGMGDIVSLVERVETTFSQEKALEMARKLREEDFTLDDFQKQLQQIKKLGPLEQIFEMFPQIGPFKKLQGVQPQEKDLKHIEAIINSMTLEERRNHKIISGSRRKRIAAGSGTSIQEVNRLLKQFTQTSQLMKQMRGQMAKKKGKGFRLPVFS
ncbi:MAG: signal recognition particle protein [Candidatus Schekmanbacteria bacterium]|nr:signal recognition particle protein [Candidatus Schekmanbacteria bacterium]